MKILKELKPGYAFEWIGAEKSIPRTQEWDITILVESDISGVEYRGIRTIDGSKCAVFYAGERGDLQRFLAQVYQEIKSETIISVHYDERDRDYFAVVQDGSGESWVVNDAKNHQHAAAIVQSAYPSADVRLA